MATSDTSQVQDQVKSVGTAFRIIETLQEKNKATVTELATDLDLSKSAVYKHLRTLENHRYIIKEEGNYRLGLRFLNLGQGVLRREELYDITKPELDNLAEDTGETANLMVEEGGRGVFISKVSSERAVNLDTYVGKEVYLHTTALGKAIMAHMPPEAVDEIIRDHGLPAITKKTISDRQNLESELGEIRSRKWAADDEERLTGLRCIAVPILDSDDSVLGAISISGPKNRMSGQRYTETIPKKLLEARNIIELNVIYK